MAAGNWVPELIEMVGAENLFGTPGAHSPWMKWEDLAASDPDVIVCAPCGYDLRENPRGDALADRESCLGWKLRAVREGRVFLADGNQYMNRPGPRIVESLQILRRSCIPRSSHRCFEGRAWQTFVIKDRSQAGSGSDSDS